MTIKETKSLVLVYCFTLIWAYAPGIHKSENMQCGC